MEKLLFVITSQILHKLNTNTPILRVALFFEITATSIPWQPDTTLLQALKASLNHTRKARFLGI